MEDEVMEKPFDKARRWVDLGAIAKEVAPSHMSRMHRQCDMLVYLFQFFGKTSCTNSTLPGSSRHGVRRPPLYAPPHPYFLLLLLPV